MKHTTADSDSTAEKKGEGPEILAHGAAIPHTQNLQETRSSAFSGAKLTMACARCGRYETKPAPIEHLAQLPDVAATFVGWQLSAAGLRLCPNCVEVAP